MHQRPLRSLIYTVYPVLRSANTSLSYYELVQGRMRIELLYFILSYRPLPVNKSDLCSSMQFSHTIKRAPSSVFVLAFLLYCIALYLYLCSLVALDTLCLYIYLYQYLSCIVFVYIYICELQLLGGNNGQ